MDVKLTSALLQGSWIKFNLKPKTVDAIAGVMVPWVKTKVCPVRKMAPPVLVDVAWPQSSSATSQRMPPLKKWQIISVWAEISQAEPSQKVPSQEEQSWGNSIFELKTNWQYVYQLQSNFPIFSVRDHPFKSSDF